MKQVKLPLGAKHQCTYDANTTCISLSCYQLQVYNRLGQVTHDVLLLIDQLSFRRDVLDFSRRKHETEITYLQKATDLDQKMAFLIVDHLQVPQHLYNTLPCSHLR
jgi:hypothetical protein